MIPAHGYVGCYRDEAGHGKMLVFSLSSKRARAFLLYHGRNYHGDEMRQ
jgi:hypothetical protein